MLRFYASTFVHMSEALERARSRLLVELAYQDDLNASGELVEALDYLERELERLPLSSSIRLQIESLRKGVKQGADNSYLASVLNTVENCIIVELSEWSFCAIPPAKRLFFEARKEWLATEVLDAYPDSEADLKAAGRCFALDEWTACVFHLMRGVETALRKWADQLGAVLRQPISEANWQEILDAASVALKTIEQQPRTPQRSEDLEYFGATSAQFGAFKNAWRNHVAHGRRTYDQREADEAMQSTIAFMRMLARRP